MIIDDVIARTLGWARASDGDNLTGFYLDTEHAFESKEIFESVHVERTDDPSRLIVVRLVARNMTPPEISNALSKAWSWLAYPGFQATAINRTADAVVMRFVTATEDGALCVTGEVIVTPARSGN